MLAASMQWARSLGHQQTLQTRSLHNFRLGSEGGRETCPRARLCIGNGGARPNFLESVRRMYRIDCVQICRSGGFLFGEHRASLTACTGDDLSACSRSALRSLTVHIELTLLASFYPFLVDLKTSQACRGCANQSCWHSIVQPEQRDAVLVLGVLIQEAARAPVKAA